MGADPDADGRLKPEPDGFAESSEGAPASSDSGPASPGPETPEPETLGAPIAGSREPDPIGTERSFERPRSRPVPAWQQPELTWLFGMPIGFAGPWLAGEAGQPLLAIPLALACVAGPWVLLLRVSRIAAAQVGLCAFTLGCALAWIDAGLLGHLQMSPLEALGLRTPWLPDPGVISGAGGVDRPGWRVALGAAVLAGGWLLGRARLGVLAVLPAALFGSELGAGFGRLAAALAPAEPLAVRGTGSGNGSGLSDGAAALVAADPGSVLLGLGAGLALGGLALAARVEDLARARFGRARFVQVGLAMFCSGAVLALFATGAYRENVLRWLG